MRMSQRLSALRNSAAFSVWFSQIVLRVALRVRPRQASPAVGPDIPTAAFDSEDVAQHLDVLAALATLTPRQRAALYLSALGYNSSEIGRIIGLLPGTVRYVLSTSRRKLRHRLLCDPKRTTRGKVIEAL